MPQLKTILVTGSGGPGRPEIITTLRELGGYRTVALDSSTYSYGLVVADCAYVVPPVTTPGYAAALDEIIDRERPDYILPTLDEEILDLHETANRFGVKLLTPRVEACRLFLDKWETFHALRAAGVPTPDTWLADDPEEIEYPAVIKPRDGRGSRGLGVLRSRHDLDAYLARAGEPRSRYVVQRQIAGTEFTVSAVVALGGPMLAVVPKEVVVKRGMTFVGVTRNAPDLDRLCRTIQSRLRADGPFNVQLMRDAEGAPWVFEINPRYSTTAVLTIAAGVHEVDLVVRHPEGGKDGGDPVSFTPDLMMVRYYTQTYLPESTWPVSLTATAGSAVPISGSGQP